mgnify:CR=1 FL=1
MASAHPLVIGHRGAPGYRPEHSRSSYELALALGVDAVTPEVVGPADRVLVVHEGRITADIPREQATAESVMFAATHSTAEVA